MYTFTHVLTLAPFGKLTPESLTHPRTGPNNSLYVMDGNTRHFRPQLSVHEDLLSTNAPKEERPCTRELATAAGSEKQAR